MAMGRRRSRSALLHEMVLITSCGFCLIIGTLIFSRGYLLNRKAIPEKATATRHAAFNSTTKTPPRFAKMIFVLVDALRYDFIHRMQFLSGQCTSSDMCCAFRCISDPPTTTMQRLKALTTGTMPTFIDVSANFNSYEIEEDSLIYQFDQAGYKIGFLGDDTWLSLFSERHFKGIVEGHPSFNAWDLDTVDYAINATINAMFSGHHKKAEWDILIAHYLGVDHCGHRYGPNHNEMKRKLDETDAALRFIYESMDTDTLLVVVGDHGMTTTGDHGGDSKEEVESGLIFLAKDQHIVCNSHLRSPVSVSQIDLVPTLATLFQLPIPFSSLGEVIPAIVESRHYLEALLQNAVQVNKYIEAYGFSSHHEKLAATYKEVISAYEQMQSKRNSTTADQFKNLATIYLQRVKKIATLTWTQFDHSKMMMGIGVCTISLVGLVFSTVQEAKLDARNRFMNFAPLLGIVACSIKLFVLEQRNVSHVFGLIFGCLCLLTLRNAVQYFRKQMQNMRPNVPAPHHAPSLVPALPFLLYGLTCFGVLSNSFVINEGAILGTTLSFLALIHCLLAKSAAPAQLKETVLQRTDFRKSHIRTRRNWKGWHIWLPFLGVLLISRVCQVFFRCREELTTCTEEFLLHKHLSSLPSDWIVHKYIRYSISLISLAVLVVSLRSFMLGRKCILSTRPCSVIGKYVPSVLVVLLCVHWALQGLLFGHLVQIQIRPLVQYFPLVFQILAIGSLVVIWWKPLCCIGATKSKSSHSSGDTSNISTTIEGENEPASSSNDGRDVKREDSSPNAEMHSTTVNGVEKAPPLDERSNFIHGSSLVTNAILVTLLLAHITSVGHTPVLTFIPYTIAGLVLMYGDSSWSAAISWTLASQFFFYATGHQPIFSSIPWDSAFTAENANNLSDRISSWVNWIQPAVSVLTNLYASQILFSLTLPLLVFWKNSYARASSHRQLYELLNLCAKFIVLHGLKLLSCLICVTIHRRHLMVWKIFTPKLIFEAIAFVAVYITMFLSVLFILRVQFIFKRALAKREEMNVNSN